MDLNIINLDNSHDLNNYSDSDAPSGVNKILKNIFKFSAFFVGILVIAMITFDLSEKILRTYADIDSSENLRKLEMALSQENFQKIKIPQNNANRILETELTDKEIIDAEEENNKADDKLDLELDKDHLIDKADQEAILNFYNKVNLITYKGMWQTSQSNEYLDNKIEGEMALKIERYFNSVYSTEKIFVTFRLLDGNVIDKWIIVKSLNFPFSNVTITNNTLTQSFFSLVEFGEIFDTNDLVFNCKSQLHFDWTNDASEDPEIIQNFKGVFTSNCKGMSDINFIMSIEEDYEDYSKILAYSVTVCVFALAQVFNTLWVNKQLNSSNTLANSISLITIVQNTVWNSYGCLCHFFLTVSYEIYKYQFGLPALIYFFNFSIFEIRLLTNLFNMKNSRLFSDPNLLRKKLVQFYFLFYLIMFFSLFYVMKFFFEKPYILIAICGTWIPQIIYNIIYNNRMSMPLVNVILFSLNKIFLPFYFRGYSDNLFKLSTDLKFLLIGFSLMLIQSILGPRWFIPYNFSNDSYNFYRSKEEIIAIKPDAEYLDCIICLFSIFNPENYRNFSDDFIATTGDPTRQSYFKCLNVIWTKLTEFHEYEYNINKKPFMMTPCKHIFHSACLESWFKQKKECPSCRQDIG